MKYMELEIKERIATLSIVRPEAMNALNREVVNEIDHAVEQIGQSEEIRVLILYSQGNFAAGADIKEMIECDERGAAEFLFSSTFGKVTDLNLPTIALIEGYALGGGLELALTCDIRIAAADAQVGFPEINLGIMPGAGGTVRTPKLIGSAQAKELIFTGEIISASRAEALGLVNRTVPQEALLDEGYRLARKIAKKAPTAIRTAKKTIHAGMKEFDEKVAIAIEGKNWAGLFNTRDQKECMRAFMERSKKVTTDESQGGKQDEN